MKARAGGGARIAVWVVLLYALLTLATWMLAPWVFPPNLLPLTRPLSAVLLVVVSGILLLGGGRLTRGTHRFAIAAVLAVSSWSVAIDFFAHPSGRREWSGTWAPYLGDGWPWISGWTGMAIALLCIALLVGLTHIRTGAVLTLASAVVAYGYIVGWVAGANDLSGFGNVQTFPLTQIAVIVLCSAAVRLGYLPQLTLIDGTTTNRRWNLLILGSVIVPLIVVALLNLVLQLPMLSVQTGNAIVGFALAGVLFMGTWRYIETDRLTRLREHEALEEAEHHALHDPLTNLANRTLAMEALSLALARSRRSGGSVTVLFCDLDGLKRVNDLFGHASGDMLIATVAQRLQSAVRDEDVVARLGGDEFLVITERLETAVERIAFAERVLASVADSVRIDSTTLHPGISVGVAVAGDDEHPIEVIRNADAAMYQAKANGRGRWEVFDPRMREELIRRQKLADEMGVALMGREIDMYLQPIVRLQDRTTVAVEALARWRHPMHGLLDTRTWLTAAEDSSNLVPIGRFIIASACRWLAADGAAMAFVSINVSPRELAQNDFADFCMTQVQQTGISPSQLAFEVADDAIESGGAAARAQIHALANAHFRIFVDCFGTGRDSLSTWRDFPVAGVKLDRQVAHMLHTDAGIRAAAAGSGLAAGLRIVGVAGGIETQEQEQEFRRLGWEFGQGFLFARPAPASVTAA